MKLVKAEAAHIATLVDLSKRAFDSDQEVGAAGIGGPPEYDSIPWHIQMMNENHLFTAVDGEKMVGGAILFPDNSSGILYVGRIFVDPTEFKRGYGIAIMGEIEKLYPNLSIFRLETPAWNSRTNQFYRKLGYEEKHRTKDEVFYEKVK